MRAQTVRSSPRKGRKFKKTFKGANKFFREVQTVAHRERLCKNFNSIERKMAKMTNVVRGDSDPLRPSPTFLYKRHQPHGAQILSWLLVKLWNVASDKKHTSGGE